jgi:hypothetical protein
MSAFTASVGVAHETLRQMEMRHRRDIKTLKRLAKGTKKIDVKRQLKRQEKALKAAQLAEIKAMRDSADADFKANGADVAATLLATAAAAEEETAAAAAAAAAENSSTSNTTTTASDAKQQPEKKTTLNNPKKSGGFAFTQGKISKAQRKRLARDAKEKKRREELLAETAELPDMRAIENKRLAARLAPLALSVHEIRSDGNCCYNAVAHQLDAKQLAELLASSSSSSSSSDDDKKTEPFQALRAMASECMLNNQDEFIAFVESADGDMMGATEYKSYCKSIVAGGSDGKVVWGGHPEIVALSKCLARRIVVHSAKGTPVIAGEAFDADDALHISYVAFFFECVCVFCFLFCILLLCRVCAHTLFFFFFLSIRHRFHQHYFGLGAHYNSVVSTKGSGAASSSTATVAAAADAQ